MTGGDRANPSGKLTVAHGGRDYALRLTWAGMADLQDRHPEAIGAMLSGRDVVPSLRFALDAVSAAIQKGEGLGRPEADEIADEMLTADPTVMTRLLAAAFPPGPEPGKAQAEHKN